MIQLGSYSFRYVVAAGALGFDGLGYWWEKPLGWLGFIDPTQFLVITKTLTLNPRAGNYRWWKPWQTVRLIPGGAVNAMGLPNPGLRHWIKKIYPRTVRWPSKDIDIAVSIAPHTVEEARFMAAEIKQLRDFWKWGNIRAIEVNPSCPNTPDRPKVGLIVEMVKATALAARTPVFVKLGHGQPYLAICEALDGIASAFDLINTSAWGDIHLTPSPLAQYGFEGGVSGSAIAARSDVALTCVKQAGIQTPVISGGGIMSYEDAAVRLARGADAISFGTLFLRKPWSPLKIIRRLEREL